MQKHHSKFNLTSRKRRVGGGFLGALLLSVVLPDAGFAQDAQDITLRFASGQDSMSGALTQFVDDKFFLESSIGLVVIPAAGVTCVGDACPDGTRLEIENAQVVLTSKDGTVSISGDLIEIDGDEYVLATSVGEQRVATSLVDCDGDGCVAPAIAEFTGPGEVELSNGVLTLKGTLLGIDNGAYVLRETVMGDINVSATEFSCVGDVCP